MDDVLKSSCEQLVASGRGIGRAAACASSTGTMVSVGLAPPSRGPDLAGYPSAQELLATLASLGDRGLASFVSREVVVVARVHPDLHLVVGMAEPCKVGLAWVELSRAVVGLRSRLGEGDVRPFSASSSLRELPPGVLAIAIDLPYSGVQEIRAALVPDVRDRAMTQLDASVDMFGVLVDVFRGVSRAWPWGACQMAGVSFNGAAVWAILDDSVAEDEARSFMDGLLRSPPA